MSGDKDRDSNEFIKIPNLMDLVGYFINSTDDMDRVYETDCKVVVNDVKDSKRGYGRDHEYRTVKIGKLKPNPW